VRAKAATAATARAAGARAGAGEGGGGCEGGCEDLRRGLVDALLVRELDDIVRRVGVLRLKHLGDLVAQVLLGQLQLLLRLDEDPRCVPLVRAGHDDLLRLVGGLGHRGRGHRGLGHRRLLRALWRHDAPEQLRFLRRAVLRNVEGVNYEGGNFEKGAPAVPPDQIRILSILSRFL
jgi:hypothetical protein